MGILCLKKGSCNLRIVEHLGGCEQGLIIKMLQDKIIFRWVLIPGSTKFVQSLGEIQKSNCKTPLSYLMTNAYVY